VLLVVLVVMVGVEVLRRIRSVGDIVCRIRSVKMIEVRDCD